jgi:DNA-binding MarR family transcriptional regulator
MRITDPQALRALAHPVRLDLIESLTALGPATAAQCARRLGTSQASCSFHLRQLARYGLVEQAPGTGDRRERPWRLTDPEQSWSTDAGPAADQLEQVFVQREAERIQRGITTRAQQPQQWRDAGFLGGATLPVTPAELRQIAEGLRAVLSPYEDRLTDPTLRPDDAQFVRIFLAATPLALTDPPAPADSTAPESPLTPGAADGHWVDPSGADR